MVYNDNHGHKKESPLFSFPNKGQFKFSMWYFLGMVLILLAVNSLIPSQSKKLIDFSDFKHKIESGEIIQVELGEKYYIGSTYNVDEKAEDRPGGIIYKTARIDDQGFIALMDSKGVNTTLLRSPTLIF